MLIYEFSGTLDGLLCAVFEAWQKKEYPDLITTGECIPQPLNYTLRQVTEEEEKALRIEEGVRQRLGESGLLELARGFASGCPERNMILFHWLMALFRYGEKIQKMFSDRRVVEFGLLISAVTLEIHRMEGKIRFRPTKWGVWLAEYAPDNDITAFLMPYFFRRFPEQPFLLQDLRRQKCGVATLREWTVVGTDRAFHIRRADERAKIQTLWERPAAAAVSSRLPDGCLSLRYRRYLTESSL